MTNVGWQGEYTDGDVKSICLDGSYTLDELRLIVAVLERGDVIHWIPRVMPPNHDYAPINTVLEGQDG